MSYIAEEHAAYPVMNFLESDDIDLTKSIINTENTNGTIRI
jgi:hypothetical protein